MIAASALVVAVLASYAGIGMLSLTASNSFGGFSSLPIVSQVIRGVGWNPPTVAGITKFGHTAVSGISSLGVLNDSGVFDLGKLTESSAPKPLAFKNTSSAPVVFTVKAKGPGLSASFAHNQPKQQVAPKANATVYVSSSAMYAGPISGELVISAPGLASQNIPIQGIQAPLAPGAVTATPAKGGAVDLSWSASASVSGVAGYLVQRSTDGATWTQVAATTGASATTAVDQTPSDGAYSYRVLAVSDGSPGADSTPSPVTTATSDSTGPNQPVSASGPAYINLANETQVPIIVTSAPGFQPGDTVTVTLTGPAGGSVTSQPTPVGTDGSTTVNVDAHTLSDGTIGVSATAYDSLGNPSSVAANLAQITKDTLAPADPGPLPELPTITNQNEDSYSFLVEGPTVWSTTSTIHAQFTDSDGNMVPGSGPAAGGLVQMDDLSKLVDGTTPIVVSVWVTDAAGNQSDKVTTTVLKQATPPAAPTDFGIAAGPDNPAGVVTPQSAHDVYITATFAQAPTADVDIKLFAHQQMLVEQPGDGQTTSFTFGPFDFSGVEPGPHHIAMMETDGVGNQTWTRAAYTVDTGATSPTSVGVPAGPNNPAGYVNAATQTAATIVATFAAPTDPADQIALSVDGLNLGEESGGSDTLSWTGDLSSLPDGTLQILGTITDQNGVQTTFTGSLIKDTTPPPAPAVAGVVGPPPNTITPHNDSCVDVAVAFNQAPDPQDTVSVTLSDGQNSAQGSAPAGDGQVTVGCIDASSLAAGPVSVTVTVTDVAGNSVTFTGTPAVKVDCQQQNQGE